MKKIAVIMSYIYDDKMTSMACAYHTCYQYLNIDERKIETTSAYQQGSIQDALRGEEIEVVPMTDELRQLCYQIKREEAEAAAQRAYEKYSKEVEEYNKTFRPQEKGQIVEITAGKHKGKVGRITWIGKNSFKREYKPRYGGWRAAAIMGIIDSRPYTIPAKDCDLVLVRPIQYGTTWEDGTEKCYIDIAKCIVTNGFKPIELTLDSCRRYNERNKDNWFAIRDGYNVKSYI
jgi:hypothetical protein